MTAGKSAGKTAPKSAPKSAPDSRAGPAGYDAFWLAYLRAHSRRRTRAIHYCGITILLAGLAVGVWTGDWRIALGGVALGYVTAWAAHFTVQGNVPVMFGGPRQALWSAVSGLRMYALGLTLRLGPHLRRAGVRDGGRA